MNRPNEEMAMEKRIDRSVWSDLIGLLLRIGWIGLIIVIAFCFVVGAAVNSGERMTPAFHDRDVVIYYRLAHDYAAGDAVVYRNENDRLLVGRIVAVPGDTVDITEVGLMINGYHRVERYATGETLLPEGGAEFPMTLVQNQYFVLCDNRNEGDDSRLLGALSPKEIKGRVMLSIRQRDF